MQHLGPDLDGQKDSISSTMEQIL